MWVIGFELAEWSCASFDFEGKKPRKAACLGVLLDASTSITL